MTISIYGPYNVNIPFRIILVYVGEILSHQLNFVLANISFFSPTEFCSRQHQFFLTNRIWFSPTSVFSRQVVFFSPTFFSSPTFSPTWVYPFNVVRLEQKRTIWDDLDMIMTMGYRIRIIYQIRLPTRILPNIFPAPVQL